MKGAKVGRLFPLQFLEPCFWPINNRSEVQHKILDHPNTQILKYLFLHGFL